MKLCLIMAKRFVMDVFYWFWPKSFCSIKFLLVFASSSSIKSNFGDFVHGLLEIKIIFRFFSKAFLRLKVLEAIL